MIMSEAKPTPAPPPRSPLAAQVAAAPDAGAVNSLLDGARAKKKAAAMSEAAVALARAELQTKRADALERAMLDKSWKNGTPAQKEARTAQIVAARGLAAEARRDAEKCRVKARQITDEWAAGEAMWLKLQPVIVGMKEREGAK